MNIYIFFVNEGFYPLQLSGDDEAIANAINNPEVYKVETAKGEKVYPKNHHSGTEH